MMNAEPGAAEPPNPPPRSWWVRGLRGGVPVASVGIGLALLVCYRVRPDAAAALTVFPAWIWLVPGLVLAGSAGALRGWRAGGLLAGAWVVFLVLTADEPASLRRALVRAAPWFRANEPAGEALRVISLNCAAGDRRAAEEVASYHPDLVLLQESPGRAAVETLARRLFGDQAGVVAGVDTSLLVRGRVEPATQSATDRAYFVQARVTLPSGRVIEVINTRLLPAVFREDLWSPDCWREQTANRRQRRAQLRAITRRLPDPAVPLILGGDFNAPQGDAIFDLLRPRLRDTFAAAGLGWGNTIINEVPALRIDQIWASDAFAARSVVARTTIHSDHRMVIGDLILRDSPRR